MSDKALSLLIGVVTVVILGIAAYAAVNVDTRDFRSEGIRGPSPRSGRGRRGPRGPRGRGPVLRTGRGWGIGRRWHPRYWGAVGYPIAGYPTWRNDAVPCVIKCADELSDCNYASPGDPLCDVMYKSCMRDC